MRVAVARDETTKVPGGPNISLTYSLTFTPPSPLPCLPVISSDNGVQDYKSKASK